MSIPDTFTRIGADTWSFKSRSAEDDVPSRSTVPQTREDNEGNRTLLLVLWLQQPSPAWAQCALDSDRESFNRFVPTIRRIMNNVQGESISFENIPLEGFRLIAFSLFDKAQQQSLSKSPVSMTFVHQDGRSRGPFGGCFPGKASIWVEPGLCLVWAEMVTGREKLPHTPW